MVSVNSERAWSCPGEPLNHPSSSGAHIVVVNDPQLLTLIPISKETAPDRPVIFRNHIQIRGDLACTPGTPQARSWVWLWHRASHADVIVSHPIPDSVPPTWCHGTGMPTIDHPADEYFVQVARFDPSQGTIDVLDSYPMFHASEMPDMAVDLIHEVMSHLADKKALKSKVSGALRKAKPVIVTDVGGLLCGQLMAVYDSETSRGPLWKPENRLLAAIRSRPDRLQITLSFRPLISSANPISIGSKHPLPGQ
ncbi:hypothetical protein LV157_003069 [Aspergillus fumigatus]|nr:hypothetical protein LV157_003069 [Aspergillus fumigatus]